jgi:hypothetical protein
MRTRLDESEVPVRARGGSESGGVTPPPRTSMEIAKVAAEAAMQAVAGVREGLVRDLDVDDSRHVLPMPRDAADQVRLLFDQQAVPQVPPIRGVPQATRAWRDTTLQCIDTVAHRVRHALWEGERTAPHADDLEIIGPHGDPKTNLARVHTCITENRPFVSVTVCGSLQSLLVTGHPWAASLSIVAKVPGEPPAFAVATAEHALAADCSEAYQLLLPEGLWKLRTEDDTQRPVAHGYLIMPRERRDLETYLEQFYEHTEYVDDTASAIAEAMLSNHMPLAFHYTGHVLQAAVVVVAAAHGFVVRPLTPGGGVMKPWECTRMLSSALTQGVDIPPIVLGQNEVYAKNLAQHLVRVPLAAG